MLAEPVQHGPARVAQEHVDAGAGHRDGRRTSCHRLYRTMVPLSPTTRTLWADVPHIDVIKKGQIGDAVLSA